MQFESCQVWLVTIEVGILHAPAQNTVKKHGMTGKVASEYVLILVQNQLASRIYGT